MGGGKNYESYLVLGNKDGRGKLDVATASAIAFQRLMTAWLIIEHFECPPYSDQMSQSITFQIFFIPVSSISMFFADLESIPSDGFISFPQLPTHIFIMAANTTNLDRGIVISLRKINDQAVFAPQFDTSNLRTARRY